MNYGAFFRRVIKAVKQILCFDIVGGIIASKQKEIMKQTSLSDLWGGGEPRASQRHDKEEKCLWQYFWHIIVLLRDACGMKLLKSRKIGIRKAIMLLLNESFYRHDAVRVVETAHQCIRMAIHWREGVKFAWERR